MIYLKFEARRRVKRRQHDCQLHFSYISTWINTIGIPRLDILKSEECSTTLRNARRKTKHSKSKTHIINAISRTKSPNKRNAKQKHTIIQIKSVKKGKTLQWKCLVIIRFSSHFNSVFTKSQNVFSHIK